MNNVVLREAATKNVVAWVKSSGESVEVGRKMAPNGNLTDYVDQIKQGNAIGDLDTLLFRDPTKFCAGELHNNLSVWEELFIHNTSNNGNEVVNWIKNKVAVFPYFRHFSGFFNQQLHGFRSVVPSHSHLLEQIFLTLCNMLDGLNVIQLFIICNSQRFFIPRVPPPRWLRLPISRLLICGKILIN